MTKHKSSATEDNEKIVKQAIEDVKKELEQNKEEYRRTGRINFAKEIKSQAFTTAMAMMVTTGAAGTQIRAMSTKRKKKRKKAVVPHFPNSHNSKECLQGLNRLHRQ